MQEQFKKVKYLRSEHLPNVSITFMKNLVKVLLIRGHASQKNVERKNYQVLTNYAKSANCTSIFDFFSMEAMAVLKIATLISSAFEHDFVEPLAIFFALYVLNGTQFEKLRQNVAPYNFLLNIEKSSNAQKFSIKSYSIFFKALEIASLKQKTPVISPEVLAIALIKNNKSLLPKVQKMVRLPDAKNFCDLLYSFFERSYNMESACKNADMSYLSYLMQTFKNEQELILKLTLNELNFAIKNVNSLFIKETETQSKQSKMDKISRKYSGS